ncbi:programmed cell death protein 6 isoform X1 [Penaeus vannamei]|uniref:programmed cell death protein 6 isoform X1 n=1 Tax=Penaeus vannamei TaxID=6689 RepID=UPI000F6657FD|nr:programmed cell death protein 6-like [Penaeus vannamei]XP_027211869.1 programmed cell death protein 6-like [Penaeus vannamei]XP_027211870.1 programmed cell death protein 6-like [Penaeus vannamei]XP_027211871.1 programmed cell death protein 6-like [Penaeus vannamei]XP_027211872.1 programmed cell death protein 6-like [Penaeus vannamei]XP_027211873.1 programmed cell death protein 6-like [Penaeus vannamei]XP_027211874.1 programmed cell death protein 6-like [Penaeus vannamei]XP_027211875.1 pro
MATGMPDGNFLLTVFQQVDKDRSGAIDARELQSALSNGNFTPFNPETIKLMIGMFDKKGSGTINFDEFGAVWKYVTDWQQCFRSFDRDGSGNISKDELKTAITTFGYRFSEKFYDVLMQRFDRTGRGGVYFDDFIQCCIVLHTLTQAFSQYDQDRDGVITISYEQFLHMVFSIRT